MRILHITPEAPGYSSGGRLGVLQTTISITKNEFDVDYVGPYIEDDNIRDLYSNVFVLSKTSNVLKLLVYAMKGITNKSYDSWNALDIEFNEYDYYVVDFTKQSYIFDKLDANKTIVRVHNVESDYAERDYKIAPSIKKWIVKRSAKSNEKIFIDKSNKVVCLTTNDRDRLRDLYDVDDRKIEIIPVCVNKPQIQKEQKKKNNILITGSLWFGGNYEGIIWFIDNVMPNVRDDVVLTIAGFKPTQELKEKVEKSSRIILIDSPSSMEPYFNGAQLVVAPVFDGAGMKVKVAEALSYGIPVVGTEHAFIGYDIDNERNSYLAGSASEFVGYINNYFEMNQTDRDNMISAVCKLYSEKYSMSSSIDKWQRMINN